MEPIKLENQIREKLNSREIQPSTQAWDRLDAMLSVAEEKKTRRPFGFLFIAASITVLIAVGMFFFTQNSIKIQPKDDVVTSEPIDTVQKPVNEIQSPILEEKQELVSTDNQNPKSHITNNNQRVSIQNQKTPNNQNQSNNPLINREKEIEFQNSSDVALKELPRVISTTPKEVQKKTTYVDVDELLASAENIGKSKSKAKSDKINVDPNTLLSHADGEVEMTFREKAINRLTKNYMELKVALANRNNE
ncbi:hypothetical protein QWY90_02630 [Flavobacterium paronense]|uniref:Uncharacterized protein n=1 Tax=Flavobacterium paronense TaxID=1392775 RepID=A0ABV5GCX7_9FLAO|nr:hypothetical protein [Flavobacterium paronense]MDN3676202.1 hypothetical protein [Flavobacterium paronense]